MGHPIQTRRTELKFVIDEPLAAGIRHYLCSQLRPDPFASGSDKLGYPVCSVYLDDGDARLYGESVDGIKNRYKLRVRIYDNDPAGLAFAEIKRRENQSIIKRRVSLDRDAATEILAGNPVSLSSLAQDGRSGRDWLTLQEFCRLRDRLRATGTTYVHYLRDAYVSPDRTDWRATFDRQLRTQSYRIGDTIAIPDDLRRSAHYDLVIFELKYAGRFPTWMQDLISVFNLRSTSFPKYVHCFDSLGVTGAVASSRESATSGRVAR